MRYGHTILMLGIILGFVAWVGMVAARVVDVITVRERNTTLVDLRVDAGHHQLFRLSFTLINAPHRDRSGGVAVDHVYSAGSIGR
jgi:hypothetical protein